jgi:hypothetical protein
VIVTGFWLAVLALGAAALAGAEVAGAALAALGVGVADVPQAASNPAIVATDAASIDRRLVRVFIGSSPLLNLTHVGRWGTSRWTLR